MTDPVAIELFKILGEIKQEIGKNSATTEAIHDQALKTNGRVTKLEEFIAKQTVYNAEQTQINSRIEGLYSESQIRMEKAVAEAKAEGKRDIDEIKKSFKPSEAILKKEIINAEGKWKVWGVLAGGAVTIIVSLITLYNKVNP